MRHRVAAQDPDTSPEAVGVLVESTVSETAGWRVNGEQRCVFAWPELAALIKAATSAEK